MLLEVTAQTLYHAFLCRSFHYIVFQGEQRGSLHGVEYFGLELTVGSKELRSDVLARLASHRHIA